MKKAFVFYRSFYEAATPLDDVHRLELFDAICEYGLNQTETEMKPFVKAMFTLIKPQIEANNTRYENGSKGGRPPKRKTETKPEQNQTETILEPKEKEKDKKKVKDKDEDIKEIAFRNNINIVSLLDFIDHRKKIKKVMTDKAIDLFVNKLVNLRENGYDIDSMIEDAIVNGWQTVYPKDSNKKHKDNSFDGWK